MPSNSSHCTSLAGRAYALLDQAERQGADRVTLLAEAVALLEQCPAPETAFEREPAARSDCPLSPDERALVGAAWVRAGQPQRGATYLDYPWEYAPPHAAGLAGSALLSLGVVMPALVALQRGVEASTLPPAPAILINLGRAMIIAGQAEAALPVLERGRAGSPDEVLAALSVAEALLALGRVDDALEQIPENPEDEPLIDARVRLLGATGRHVDAAVLLHTARAKFPKSLPLLLLGAELADVRGRRSEAAAMLKKALEQEPDNIALWARLALTGQKGTMNAHAREAADKCLELVDGKEPLQRAIAVNAHAHVLAEEGRTNEAESAYREALQLVPGFVQALSGLGQLLLQNGKVDAAMDCFQQVRAVAPMQGWCQLIQAREVPDDTEVLEGIERAARQPGLEGPVRSGLLFTAAAAWDRKKEHDRAMIAASEANEACKALLDYDPAQHRQLIEREIARFSTTFMQSRRGWGNPSRLPVFVLGMPRSGTTLTEQILGSHSQVFGAGELGLVGEHIARLDSWERHLGSGLSYPESIADLDRERSRKIAADWLQQLQALAPDARHVIDKLPHNFEHVGLIKLLFPEAIIFHCRRNPRDIAVSNYITDYAAKFGGMGFAYDLGWIGQQLVDHDRLMRHWHTVFPGQIFEVVYEDLVEDTEDCARRMIAFAGLEWEPGVMAFQNLERPVKTASIWQVRQPVYTTSKARWRHYEAHLGKLEAELAIVPSMPNAAPLPPLKPGLFTQAMAHLAAGRPEEAEAAFLRIIASYPGHAAAYHFLGASLLQQNKPKKAVSAMRHAIKLLPKHPSWWENLAKAEAASGNETEARMAWETGQRLRQGSDVLK